MQKDGDERGEGAVPEPKPSGPHGELPHALTFYLTVEQRRAVLAVVRKFHRTRALGLLRALGIESDTHQ
jgi:hypothetical protein